MHAFGKGCEFRRWLVALIGATLAMAGFGALSTVYVDDDNYGKSGDGSTEAKAFGTIQEGVDAVAAGGTVIVLPGDYNQDYIADEKYGNCRVKINKGLTLKSRDGKAVTHIYGAKDPDTINVSNKRGIGPKAIRCITVTKNSESSVVNIEGFTLRDGACGYDGGSDSHLHSGGGVINSATSSGLTNSVYYTTLIDCTVQDCVATRGGGTRYVQAVRTLYDRCGNYSPGNKNGAAARAGKFYHCVFRDSLTVGAVCDGLAVNCTFAYNNGYPFSVAGGTHIYDSYILGHVALGGDASRVFVENSVIDNSGDTAGSTCDAECLTGAAQDLLMAPLCYDFRPVAGSVLVGKGKRSNLDRIPEEYRYKDYDGNAISKDDSVALCVGAVQQTATPVCGEIMLSRNADYYDGYRMVDGYSITNAYHAYIHATAWPTQMVLTATITNNTPLWGWQMQVGSSWSSRFPDMQGRLFLMPPKDTATTYMIKPVVSTAVLYADPENGSDADDNDGQDPTKPLKTLQRANVLASKVSGARTLVICAAGTYNEGGNVSDTVGNSRLYITKPIRFLGAGSDQSTIEGVADSDGWGTAEGTVNHDGCGDNAYRCVHITSDASEYAAVQGFRLYNGHTGLGYVSKTYEKATQSTTSIADEPPARGGAMYVPSGKNGYLLDCAVEECSGSRGAAVYGGTLIRCSVDSNTMMQNSAGNAIIRTCTSFACAFRSNNSRNTQVLGIGAKHYHCSVCSTGGEPNGNESISVYNTVVQGGKDFVLDKNKNVCVFGSAYHATDVGFVNAPGKMQLTVLSPGISCSVIPEGDDYTRIADSGIDGERLWFTDGKPTAGAYQGEPYRVFRVADGSMEEIEDVVYKVAPTGTQKISTTPDEGRHYLGVTVDGELKTSETTYTLKAADYSLAAREIAVNFAYATNWYVNADSTVGSDTNAALRRRRRSSRSKALWGLRSCRATSCMRPRVRTRTAR